MEIGREKDFLKGQEIKEKMVLEKGREKDWKMMKIKMGKELEDDYFGREKVLGRKRKMMKGRCNNKR